MYHFFPQLCWAHRHAVNQVGEKNWGLILNKQHFKSTSYLQGIVEQPGKRQIGAYITHAKMETAGDVHRELEGH
jgi:cobalamin biosynthesis Co2+ chelatase CbiK